MDYYFKPSAIRDLRKLPKEVQRRILQKLDFFVSSNNPMKFAEALQDSSLGSFRFRIGNYRVIFDVDKDKIIILVIGDRKNVYK